MRYGSPPRGGRQLRRRQGVRRQRARAGDRRRGLEGSEPRPAGRQDRQRGAGEPDGRHLAQARLRLEAADRGDARRAQRSRQDDGGGEARPLRAQARQEPVPGRVRHLPAGGHRPAAADRARARGARLQRRVPSRRPRRSPSGESRPPRTAATTSSSWTPRAGRSSTWR